jgi:rSAM/selenodomain-associated transferase 1
MADPVVCGRTLVIFVRAPAIGAVKRRLAAGIGPPAAQRFYRETTRRLIRRVAADRRWTTWLAVTPDEYARRGRFWPTDLPRFPQGGGDLGRRMARALGRSGGPSVLVGSDIPDLDVCHVAAAFAALGRADLVFGPATDGGYWLVGVRSPFLLGGLFDAVRWSGPHALADTLANARRRRIALLDPLDDVDDARDLRRIGLQRSRSRGSSSAKLQGL